MATFTNQATLTYNGNTTSSNITTGELVEVLSVTKTAVSRSYRSNDNLSYVISIVNSGTSAYTGLTVTDNLGSYAFGTGTRVPLTYEDDSVQYYVNGVLQTAPTVTAGPPLVFSGISVPAGGNATLIYEAVTNQYAPLGTDASISNEATLTGTGITALTADASVATDETPVLTISKSMCPSTVVENGQVTYTFIIQNTGGSEATATDSIVVTDTFNPVLNSVTATFNGTTWTAGTNYTYDTSTGVFTTTAGQITVPAATYTQDSTSGSWTVNPGVSVLTVTGTV